MGNGLWCSNCTRRWAYQHRSPEKEQREMDGAMKKETPAETTEGSGKRKRMGVWDQHRAVVENEQRSEAGQKSARILGDVFEETRRAAAGDGEEQDEGDPEGDLYEEKSGQVEDWDEDDPSPRHPSTMEDPRRTEGQDPDDYS